MKTKYVVTKENYKKLYLRRLRGMDIFYFVLATLLYLAMTYKIIRYNLPVMLILYLIYVGVFLFIIFLFNRIYASIMMKFQEKSGNPYGEFLLEIKDGHLLWGTKKDKMDLNLDQLLKVKCKGKSVDLYILEKGKTTCYSFQKEFFVNQDFEEFKKQFEPFLLKKN